MNKYRVWLFIILLIALALRLYNLTYHSFWFDEAISVHWARQTVPRILEVGFSLVEDRLPPLYYLLLKGWTALAGFSEAGVRMLSAVLGTLLVPIVATIAKTLFNRRVALITALLVALNPFLIWYSQEARMYAPAVLFSTLTIWAFLQASTEGQRRENVSLILHPLSRIPYSTSYILLFTLFAIAGLYTHLYTGFVLPALGLWVIISHPGNWRMWVLFALSGLVIALAFTPLALATWRFSGEATPADPLSGFGQRAWWLLQAFTLWKAPLPPLLQITIPVIVAVFAAAAYFQLKSNHPSSPIPNRLLLVTLLLITPFIIANLLLWRNHLAFFGERYFIVMVPWLLLLAATGMERISKPAREAWAHQGAANSIFSKTKGITGQIKKFWPAIHNSQFSIYNLLFIIFILVTTLPLPGQWSIPAAKEAWRQSVAYLAGHAAPDHGILIHPDWVRYPFQFYFRGPGQTYAAFSNVTPETALDGPLQGVVNNHPVIWLVQSHLDGPDPHHLVERWFASRYPLVTELYPPGISVKGYAPGYQLDMLPSEVTPSQIQFENGLRLIGYQTDRAVAATDELFHPPSGWVHVTLYWTATKSIREDAVPLVNLIGSEGVWGASLERVTDALKFYPTSRWPAAPVESLPHFIIRHDVDVNLNPLTPPGVYQLVVGLQGHSEEYPLAQIEVR